MRIGAVATVAGTSAPKARMEMSDATVKLMDITSDMSSALRAGADDGRATQRNGKEQTMSDTYKFKRRELRAELFKACCALINSRPIAEYTYEFIVEPLDDFLSEHEVKGEDNEM